MNLNELKHMDVIDMPSDPNGYLGKFRATLRGTYNANRSNANAIALYRETLEFALGMLAAADAAPEPESPAEAEAPSAPEKQTSKAKPKAKSSTRAAQRNA